MMKQLTNLSDEPVKIAEIYTDKVRSLFTDVQESRSQVVDDVSKTEINRIMLKTNKGSFVIWYTTSTAGIDIEGADTGYWNLSEEATIDNYFWYAVGVLRNGIRYRKSFLGLQQAWIYSDENDKWAVVPRVHRRFGYTTFRDRFPK